jgi:hypothetical protein
VVKRRSAALRSFDDSEEEEEGDKSLHLDWERETGGEDQEKKGEATAAASERFLKSSWMKGVSQDMFQPRQQAPQYEDLNQAESAAQLDATDEMSSQGYPLAQGLGQAIIEDYYPGLSLCHSSMLALLLLFCCSRSQRQQLS